MSGTANHEPPITSAPSPAGEVRRAVAAAYQLYGTRRYSDASDQCTRVLRELPNQFDALYLQALTHYRAGDHRAADLLIERACNVCPDVLRFDHLVALLEHHGQADWLSVHETRLREFRRSQQIDAYVVSYPKCGRTWVRMMLGHYLLRGRPGDPLEIFELTRREPGTPTIEFTHDDYPQLKPSGRLFSDKSIYQGKQVVLLVRDPRDVLVSYYFQYTRRGAKERANDVHFDATISDFIRQDIGALKSIIAFYNIWVPNRMVPRSFHLLRYEALHHDPAYELCRLIDFLALPDFGANARDNAIHFAKFENMKRLEETGALRNSRLRPTVAGDPEAFKVRRGVVGGYRNYLSADDIAYVEDHIARELDPFYTWYR
ncbi:MAG: sulfotransferase domain-containing protein [Rhodospirillales bacterium]|nr:sulfotransferase domain-containing protein [Rhodospirillales bacterium]